MKARSKEDDGLQLIARYVQAIVDSHRARIEAGDYTPSERAREQRAVQGLAARIGAALRDEYLGRRR